MMTATMDREQETARTAYAVARETDSGVLREILSGDRAYAAYAIAQLEPARFARSEFYVATSP